MANSSNNQSTGQLPDPGPPPQQGQFGGGEAGYFAWEQAMQAWQAAEDAFNAQTNSNANNPGNVFNNTPPTDNSQKGKPAGVPANYVWNGTAWVPPTTTQTPYTGPSVSGSGGATAYEQALLALDKKKLADAEAQQAADEKYRQAQALDTWTKNWQDFQTKHYYGSIAGPAYAAPAGAAQWWKMPEPDYVQQYYQNNPKAGPDPWNQPAPVSGYSGSLFLNPQQPGTQSTPPMGGIAAPIAGTNQSAGPTPGTTSGNLPVYDPNAPQSGQNVPPPSMAGGGSAYGNELAVVHGGEQLVEPQTIGATGIPTPQQRPPVGGFVGANYAPPYNPYMPIPSMAGGGMNPGQVPGPPGQPQLAVLKPGEGVIPGGNFSPDNPSPVANAGPEGMNPIIRQLLSAVNAIITSPDFQSVVYSSPQSPSPDGSGGPPPPPGNGPPPRTPPPGLGAPPGGGGLTPPPINPAGGGPGPLPGSFAFGKTTDETRGGVNQAPPAAPPPRGNPVNQAPPASPPPRGNPVNQTPPPIVPVGDDVVAGPAAINHVNYGPELTGMDQLGALITPNGTPVVASEWQLQHLDPTSLARYQDYAGSIAGWNPDDLKMMSQNMTGNLNENAPTIKAPIKFDLSGILPVPGGSGG